MRPQTPSSYQNQPGWPSLDLRDSLDDWEPSRSRCGGDVAPVSVPHTLHLRQLCDTSQRGSGWALGGGWGAGFFLELHLTLSGWFIPGGAEAGNSGRGGWLRRTETMSPVSESAQQFRVASPPHTCIPSVYSPGPGIRSPLPRPSPTHTHALETTNCFFVFFFFLRLLGVNTQRLLFANCSRVLSVCAESFSSSPSSSSPVRQNAG